MKTLEAQQIASSPTLSHDTSTDAKRQARRATPRRRAASDSWSPRRLLTTGILGLAALQGVVARGAAGVVAPPPPQSGIIPGLAALPDAVARAIAETLPQPEEVAGGGLPLPPLHVRGKDLVRPDGTRLTKTTGFNMVDTRACNVFNGDQVTVAAQKRLIDRGLAHIDAGIIRYNLESAFASGTGNSTLATDPVYRKQQLEILDHIGLTHRRYVILSPWITPSEAPPGDGAPTLRTDVELRAMAKIAATRPYMLLGVGNENKPRPASEATDINIYNRMQHAIETIRSVSKDTVISVETFRNWNRYFSPVYESRGFGPNVVINVHLYGGESPGIMAQIEASPRAYIIEEMGPTGERIEDFGPHAGALRYADFCALGERAIKSQIPMLAWNLYPEDCFPSMMRARPGTDPRDGDVELNTYGKLMAQLTHNGSGVPQSPRPPALRTPPRLQPAAPHTNAPSPAAATQAAPTSIGRGPALSLATGIAGVATAALSWW